MGKNDKKFEEYVQILHIIMALNLSSSAGGDLRLIDRLPESIHKKLLESIHKVLNYKGKFSFAVKFVLR